MRLFYFWWRYICAGGWWGCDCWVDVCVVLRIICPLAPYLPINTHTHRPTQTSRGLTTTCHTATVTRPTCTGAPTGGRYFCIHVYMYVHLHPTSKRPCPRDPFPNNPCCSHTPATPPGNSAGTSSWSSRAPPRRPPPASTTGRAASATSTATRHGTGASRPPVRGCMDVWMGFGKRVGV